MTSTQPPHRGRPSTPKGTKPPPYQAKGTPARLITRQQYNVAVAAALAYTDQLRAMTCAGRVLAATAMLLGDGDHINGADLARAIREPSTVDVALDLLEEAGAPCNQ